MTVFKALPIAFSLALPWLISATAGPVAYLGAWLVSGCVLAGLLFFQSTRHWPVSLFWAAGLSLGMALLQFAGVAAGLAPWVSESASGEMVVNLRQRNQFASLMAMGGLVMWLRYLSLNGRRHGIAAVVWLFL